MNVKLLIGPPTLGIKSLLFWSVLICVFVATGWSLTSINQDRSLTIKNYKQLPEFALLIKNISDTALIKMGIRNPSFIKLYSNQIIVDELMLDKMPEEEQALTIWNFINERTWHCRPISGNSHDLHDPVKLINVFGCGYCDDAAAVMANLSIKAGLKARVWLLNGHVVAEIFYGGKWHMFDVNQHIIYRDSLHDVLNLEFLSHNPDFIRQYSEKPLMFSRKEYADFICSINDNEITEWHLNKHSQHSMFFVLNPDDEVQFHFKEKEFNNISYGAIYPTTGKLFRFLKRNREIQFDKEQLIYSERFPYAIDSIIIKFKTGNDYDNIPVKVFYSIDSENWVEIGEINDSSKSIHFEPYNQTGEKFTFTYFLRFSPSALTDENVDVTALIENLSIENRFMFSYFSLIDIREKHLKLLVENINGRKKDIEFHILSK